MNSMKFNACPRCRGTLYLQQDFMKEWYETCLQCGYTKYLDTLVDVKKNDQHIELFISDSDRDECICY